MFDNAARMKVRLHDRWWDDRIVVRWRPRCSIRVLMVADGASFGTANGYELSRVLQAIQHDLPSWVTIEVTTAKHASAGFPDPSADIDGLRFHSHDLSPYDQIWLFAVFGGDSLEPGEGTALWEFMQGGGGVFATGDHEALGEGLCARIPRVRSMRRWYYPFQGPNGEPVAPAVSVNNGPGENDSTTLAGGTEFDGVPQTIRPVTYSAPGPFVFLTREFPHPVLCGADGRITRIPDHMHEGLVEVPADLEMPIAVDGSAVEEYPRRGGIRLAPEVIAHSTINNNPHAGPFGVIGAYDGHLVDEIRGGVGRVVVDATWHHFWNMNVEQFATPHDAVVAAAQSGTAPDPDDIEPAAAWEEIRDYFQNIAFWLARASTQRCLRRRALWVLVHHVDVVMALRSAPVDRVARLLGLGAKARTALGQIAPQCERLRITWEIPELVEPRLPWRPVPPDPPPWERQVPLLDPQILDDLVLGAQLEAVAELVGGADTEEQAAAVLDSDRFDIATGAAATAAVDLLGARLRADADRLERLGPGRG